MNAVRFTTFILVALTAIPACGQSNSGRNWDKYPDYDALRNEIGWSENYPALCEDARPLRAVGIATKGENWSEVIATAVPWLEQCPIDFRIHWYLSLAYEMTLKQDQAYVHTQWFEGLLESIAYSGDGSRASPYVSISVGEEYDVLFFLGLRHKQRSQITTDIRLDVFSTENAEGEEFTMYFAPEAHFVRMDKAFGG